MLCLSSPTLRAECREYRCIAYIFHYAGGNYRGASWDLDQGPCKSPANENTHLTTLEAENDRCPRDV